MIATVEAEAGIAQVQIGAGIRIGAVEGFDDGGGGVRYPPIRENAVAS